MPQGIPRRGFLSLGTAVLACASSAGTCLEASASPVLAETSSVSGGSSVQKNTSYNLEIPFSSIRQYKTITLFNGLPVLLVSDRRAYRASAALSVGGAGQFADPPDLPGLAHLMEHMILSYNSKGTFKRSRDFEDWLGDNEGASNAFTAYDNVCFHFSCPESALPEALQRFAGLFVQEDVEKICRDRETLKREIERVDSELDFDSVNSQANYLTKDFVNLEHPYSRFSVGSLDTLETYPKELGIDVGTRLIAFFKRFYLPRRAVLVIKGRQDLYALERLAAPFGSTMSRVKPRGGLLQSSRIRHYPGAFLEGSRLKQLVLFRKRDDTSTETISFQWTLNLDYRDGPVLVTATHVAFVLARILGRRGPGSLYLFLLRRGWVPSGGVPRVLVPVNVSGFQIIRLVLPVTLEGLINRSAVVSALFDCLDTLRSRNIFIVTRDLIRQYAATAKLYGYTLAPRPADSIELAIDAQLYGLGEMNGVGTGQWYLFPEKRNEIAALQKAVLSTLLKMANPSKGLVIATAGSQVLAQSEGKEDAIPPLSSLKWQTEPITGARFYFEDMLKTSSKVEQVVLKRIINRNELSPPVINPLVPSTIRPPRIVQEVMGTTNANELIVFRTANAVEDEERLLRFSSSSSANNDGWWEVLDPLPGQRGISLPMSPPESTCRCAFVIQLLSSRPARAHVRQGAQAELWKTSFDAAFQDVAELGAPGALAYELSFNKFGLRISVLGISQTLPSYTRRLGRRLVEHHLNLLQGPEFMPSTITAAAIAEAEHARNVSQQRKRIIISNLRRSSAYEAAIEGNAFLRSCTGVVSFAQGDLLRNEINDLVENLKMQFSPFLGTAKKTESSATPDITDLLYKPVWKPRSASPCSISGVPLISDACGRIPR
jgi:insulysin